MREFFRKAGMILAVAAAALILYEVYEIAGALIRGLGAV